MLFLVGVALLPVMQFGSLDAFGAVVIPADVCFGLAAVCVGAVEIARRGVDLRGAFPIAAATYLGAMVVAALAAPEPRESLERVVIDGYCAGLGVLAYALARDASRRTRIAWAWLVGTVATVAAALLGIVRYYLGARTNAQNFGIGDLGTIDVDHVPRVVGLFANSNMLCSFLVAGLLFSLVLVGWRRPVGIVLVAAIVVALVFTFSPGLGGAAIAVALWLVLSEGPRWSTRVRRAVLAAGVAAVAAGLALAAVLGPRGRTWVDAVGTFLDHPLLGVGPGQPVASTLYNHRYFTDAHHAWLSVAGQAGVVGLLGLVAVVGTVCVLAWRARPLAAVPEPVRAAWCAFVGVVLYGGLTLSLEQTRHVWVLLGFVAAGLVTSGVGVGTASGIRSPGR